MAVRFSDEQVLQATGGKRVRPGARASYGSVCTDSRKLESGCLFVALKGERFDGHAFLSQVSAQGGAAAVVERGAALPPLPDDFALFEVEDTLRALGGLARFHRQRFKGKVAAVGGSNGKTTTKELVGTILAEHGPSLKTEGNLNNEVGVPLTLFRLGPQHLAAVIEVGMNHPGEVERLAAMVQPDAALITVVQPEHLEGLGSIEGVAEAEGELFRGLRKSATAVVNLDDPLVVNQARQSGAQKLTYGRSPKADVRLLESQSRGREGLLVKLASDGVEYEVKLSLLGAHNAQNAAGAFALARALEVPADICVRGLEAARAHTRRLNVVDAPGGVVVLDDCYNANPGSMEAALATLAGLAPAGRSVAVLGDMLELGSGEEAAHQALGGQATRTVGRVAFFGSRSVAGYLAALAAGAKAAHFVELEPLLEWVRTDLKPGDVVLVKGSRGMRLERVVEQLTGTPSGGGLGH